MFKKITLAVLTAFLCLSAAASAQEIYQAAWQGDIKKINELLKEDPGLVNHKDSAGETPLFNSVIYRQLKAVELFLKKGADINERNNDGKTPLIFAAEFGRKKVTEYLLKHSADLNLKDNNGRTALFYAVAGQKKEIVNLLYTDDSELDVKGENGRILLHGAALCGHKKLFDRIVLLGADIFSGNDKGGNLLHSVAAGGLPDYVRLLTKKGMDVNAKNSYGLTPLHKAAANNNLTVAEVLIEKNTCLNIKSCSGKTPYHMAVDNKNTEIQKLLTKHGADNSAWKFPVFKGAYFGYSEPGKNPQIFAPGILSTEDGFEFSGTFSPDVNEYYFTKRKQGYGQRVWYTKIKNGRWTQPELAPFTYDCFEFEPYISSDGKYLFFGSKRPLPGQTELNPSPDYWILKKSSAGWGEPQFYSEKMMYVSLTDSGILYYTGFPPGKNYQEIYKKSFPAGIPERLEDSINSLPNAGHPFVSPDESFLLFDAEPGGREKDIYVSFRKKDGTWTPAVNLGDKVNSTGGEMCPSVSPDGKYVFFEKNGDIYWMSIKLIESLRAEDL